MMACTGNDTEEQTAHVSVRMADAPGDYDEVNVEVIDVMVKSNETDDESGWVSVGNVAPGIYDLLTLTGGTSILLAENDIPYGHIGQIRLILGTHNTVKKDGIIYPLKAHGGQEPVIKFIINKTLEPGVSYDYFLDFDVANSVIKEAAGKYSLRPVIRLSEIINSGVIKGIVAPAGIQFTATINLDGTNVSTYASGNGIFEIHGVPAGTYSVTLTPELNSGFSALTVHNVMVVEGSVTNMESLTFQ